MSIVIALARREILGALRSPRYYILIAFYLFAQGYEFSQLFLVDGALALRQLMREIAFLALFAAPLLSAGCFAGERRSGELRHLLTEPISEWQIVIGKFLGSVFLVGPIIMGALIPVIATHVLVDTSSVSQISPIIGLALLAITCTACGLFTSSFTNHAAAAAVCALAVLLLIAGLGLHAARQGEAVSFLLGHSGPEALNPFWLIDFLFRGVIDTRPLITFPVMTLGFLWLAKLVLQTRRWKFIGKEGPRNVPKCSSRAFLVSCRLGLHAVPVILVVGLVNLTALRFYQSWDLSGYLTPTKAFTELIASSPAPVTVYRVSRRSRTRTRLSDLLDEMSKRSTGKLTHRPWTAAIHQERLRIRGLLLPPRDGVIIELGQNATHIPARELDVESREAERSIAEAVLRLIPGKTPFTMLCSLGFGERSLGINANERVGTNVNERVGANVSARAGTNEEQRAGINVFCRLAGTLGISARTVALETLEEIEPKNTIVAIIGPRLSPSEAVLKRTEDFLQAGGRLIVCADPEYPAATTELLSLLDVKMEPGVIVDPAHALAGAGPTSLLVMTKHEHPLSAPVGKIGLVIPTTASLSFCPPLETPLRSYLLHSSPSSKLAPSLHDVPNATTWSSQKARPIALTSLGPRATHPWRAVFLGDSDMLCDKVLVYKTNVGFALALLAWLCELEAPETIRAGPIRPPPVLTGPAARNLLYATCLLPALLAMAFGFRAYLAYRRRVATTATD